MDARTDFHHLAEQAVDPQPELVRRLYLYGLPSVLAGIAAAIAVTLVLWDVTANRVALIWAGLFLLIHGGRLLLIVQWGRSRPGDEDIKRWGQLYSLGALAGGLAWGSLVVVDWLLPLPEIVQLILMTALAGVGVASIPANALHPPTFIAFIAPLILGFLIAAANIAGDYTLPYLMLAAAYVGVLVMVSRDYRGRLTEAIEFRLQNTALMQGLSSSYEQMRDMAYRDALTGLHNRRAFFERFDRWLEKRQPEESIATLLLDLDAFKQVNDLLGHAAGDEVLQTLADRLDDGMAIASLEHEWRVFPARLGGDEFIAIVAGKLLRETVTLVAEELLERLREPMTVQGESLRMTVSIGVSFAPDHGVDADELIAAADRALYYSKDEGKNRCAFYIPSMGLSDSHGLFRERSVGGH